MDTVFQIERPIAKVGITDKQALVRVNEEMEDINFPCQGSTLLTTLMTVESQSDASTCLSEQGGPR